MIKLEEVFEDGDSEFPLTDDKQDSRRKDKLNSSSIEKTSDSNLCKHIEDLVS